MERALDQLVWQRAGGRCEHCQVAPEHDRLPFEIDHIVAKKHGGARRASKLCLACFVDNNHKGANIAGLDPRSRRLTALFHSRRHKWGRHFSWDGPLLVGLTPIGRTTIAVWEINLDYRVAFRQGLIDEGVFPPP